MGWDEKPSMRFQPGFMDSGIVHISRSIALTSSSLPPMMASCLMPSSAAPMLQPAIVFQLLICMTLRDIVPAPYAAPSTRPAPAAAPTPRTPPPNAPTSVSPPSFAACAPSRPTPEPPAASMAIIRPPSRRRLLVGSTESAEPSVTLPSSWSLMSGFARMAAIWSGERSNILAIASM